jgi:hypothetical protein
MIYDLAWPLMTESMENRDSKDKPIIISVKKTPIRAATLKLAANIVKKPYGEPFGKVLKQSLNKHNNIVLLFACRPHIYQPKNNIMATD